MRATINKRTVLGRYVRAFMAVGMLGHTTTSWAASGTGASLGCSGERRNTYRIFKQKGPSPCGGEAAISTAVGRLTGDEFSTTQIACPDLAGTLPP